MKRHVNAKKRRNTDPSCRSWPTNMDARSSNSSRSSKTRRRKRSRRSTIVRLPSLRPNVSRSLLRRGRDRLVSMLLKGSVPRNSPSWKLSARRKGSRWQLRKLSGRLQEQNRCSNFNSSKTRIARLQKTSHHP